MRKLLASSFWLLALLFPVLGFGQGVAVTGTALKSINGQTAPFGSATITVCAASISGTPCSPVLSGVLFQDVGLTVPVSNPFSADSNGNYTFFIAAGNYTVSISGSGFAGYSYQVTAQCTVLARCTFNGPMTLIGPNTIQNATIQLPLIQTPTITGSDAGVETLNNKTLSGNVNGLATFGNSIATVVAATSQKAETAADTNVLTFTPPASAGSYNVCFVMSVSAANTATLGWTISWKDPNGNPQSPTNLGLEQLGTAAPALTFATSAAGEYQACKRIDVDASATNIIVKLTFSGTSFAAKVTATVEKII